MVGMDFDNRERVRQATDIVDLMGRSLDLRRQGRNFVARCPWHDDRRPSLQVNPERQSWKCWVCNIGGDVFSYVMKQENVGFAEALQMLADRAGISLADSKGASSSKNRDEKQRLFKALVWASAQFREFLAGSQPEAAEARAYLEQRGIEQRSIEEFHIGYAPDQWSWLIDRSRGAGVSLQDLEAIGLVSRTEASGKPIDRFRGRVIFPIRDTQRRPIAFGGRILPSVAKRQEEQMGRAMAKYINSPETRMYSKSDHLYGLDTARDEVTKQRRLVVMEGYTDVVMAWQYGIGIATAVLGTALNDRHIKLIRRFAEQVVLLLDGDAAGQKRANEVLDLFVGTDLDLRILTLPDNLDPCDYLRERGRESLWQLIDQAPDALEHKLNVELAGIDPLKETNRAFHAAERVLATLALAPRVNLTDSSARLREQQIVTRLSRSLAIPDEELRRRLNVLRRQRRQPEERLRANESTTRSSGIGFQPDSDEPGETTPPRVPDKVFRLTPPKAWPIRELELIELLLLAPDQIDLVLENVSHDEFVDPTMRTVYEWIEECYHSGLETSFSNLITAADHPDLKSLLVELDERAGSRPKSDLAGISKWLQLVLAAFDKVRVDRVQQQTMAALSSRKMSEAEEEEALLRMLQEKQREQELRRPDSAL